MDGTKLPVRDFKSYIDLFLTDKEKPRIYEKVNDRWEVCCSISDGSFQQVFIELDSIPCPL